MNKLVIVALLVLVAIAAAEPPRFRKNQRRFNSFARQEEQPASEAPDNASSTTPAAEEAEGPYPRVRPSGRLLALPARTKFSRFSAPPARQQEESAGYHYPKPTETYGPPEEETEAATTEAGESTTTEASTEEVTTTDPDTESIEGDGEVAAELKQAPGFYYIQLPNGFIQQVFYVPEGSGSSANIKVGPAPLVAQPVFVGSLPKSFSFTSQLIQNN